MPETETHPYNPSRPRSLPLKLRLFAALIGMLSGTLLAAPVGMVLGIPVGFLLGFIVAGMDGAVMFSFFGMLIGAVIGACYWGLYGLLYGALTGQLWWESDSGSAYSPRTLFRVRSILKLVCLTFFVLTCLCVWLAQNPVTHPQDSEIEAISASLECSPGKTETKRPIIPTFSVPEQHIPLILSALRPAKRDWAPWKWVYAGKLEITLKDGKTMTVELYFTYQNVGAFSIHAGGEPRNSGLISHYFRGGTDDGIEAAIRQAFAKAKSQS